MIGAATAIFSVIDNVLLDPWPYRDADRIAVIFIRDQERPNNGGRGAFFTPEFIEGLSLERLRHIFVALCLQAQQVPIGAEDVPTAA